MFLKACFVNTAPVLLKQRCPEKTQSQSATCRCFLTEKRCWMTVPPHLRLSTEVPLDSHPAELYGVYCTCIWTPTLFKSVSGVHQELVNDLHWAFSNFISNLNHRKFLPALNIQKQRAARYRENLLGKYHYLIVLFLYSSLGICYWHWQTQMLYHLVHKSPLSIEGRLSCNNLSHITALKKPHQN